jgi:hypothetical protein
MGYVRSKSKQEKIKHVERRVGFQIIFNAFRLFISMSGNYGVRSSRRQPSGARKEAEAARQKTK